MKKSHAIAAIHVAFASIAVFASILWPVLAPLIVGAVACVGFLCGGETRWAIHEEVSDRYR